MSEMKRVTVVLQMLIDSTNDPVEEWNWHDLLDLGGYEEINIIDVHTSSVIVSNQVEDCCE